MCAKFLIVHMAFSSKARIGNMWLHGVVHGTGCSVTAFTGNDKNGILGPWLTKRKRDGRFFSNRKRECGSIVGSGRKKGDMAKELGITISTFLKITVCELCILSHN